MQVLFVVVIFTENATSVEIEELLEELHLMKYMKPHENILNLLGHCTTRGAVLVCVVETCVTAYYSFRDFVATIHVYTQYL